MDHTVEILAELKALRLEVTRQTVILETVQAERLKTEGKMNEFDGRLRAVEQGLAGKLALAGAGGAGLSAIVGVVLEKIFGG